LLSENEEKQRRTYLEEKLTKGGKVW